MIEQKDKCKRCKREFRSDKEKEIANQKEGLCWDCEITVNGTEKQRLALWSQRKSWRKKHKLANPNAMRQSPASDFYENTYLNTPQSGRVRTEMLSENTQRILRKQQADYND